MQELAIGIGLFINLVMVEITGFAAGGMVVPGYIALQLHSPLKVICSIAIGWITYLTIQYLALHMIIYGRRLLMFSILLGFIYARLFDFLVQEGWMTPGGLHLQAVGIIVPGLIAYWMSRQGVLASVCCLLTGSAITRMILVIISGGNL